jgi:hypothetical protein
MVSFAKPFDFGRWAVTLGSPSAEAMPEPEHIDRRRAALIAYDVCRRALTSSDSTRRAGASVHSAAVERLSSAFDVDRRIDGWVPFDSVEIILRFGLSPKQPILDHVKQQLLNSFLQRHGLFGTQKHGGHGDFPSRFPHDMAGLRIP